MQILLGHSKIENTVRYLGVDVEDALALAEATEIFSNSGSLLIARSRSGGRQTGSFDRAERLPRSGHTAQRGGVDLVKDSDGLL